MINFISHCELSLRMQPVVAKHFYNRLTFINVPHHLRRWTMCTCVRVYTSLILSLFAFAPTLSLCLFVSIARSVVLLGNSIFISVYNKTSELVFRQARITYKDLEKEEREREKQKRLPLLSIDAHHR